MDHLVTSIQQVTKKVNLDVLTGEFYLILEAIRYFEKKANGILKTERRKSPVLFRSSFVRYEPYGVVLLFAPWNYPIQLTMVPLITALLAGNSVIIKPSEKIPDIVPILDKLIQAMNLPYGLVRIVEGGPNVGEALINEKPNKIFFTGSRNVGVLIAKQAASLLIPCDLELSGKDPMLVFADANLERAARAAVWGSFVNTGQVCVSVERVYVEKSVYPQFINMVVTLTSALSNIGAMTTKESYEVVNKQLQQAVDLGAEIIHGGHTDDDKLLISPTVIVHVNHNMKLMQEETFGPILAIMPFGTEEEAITLANDSPFGLNAYLFTSNPKRINRLIPRLQSGNVYVNDVLLNIANIHLPFGGVKESGTGRYHGKEGLLTFVQSKSIMIYQGKRKRNSNWFPYTIQAYTVLKKWFEKFY